MPMDLIDRFRSRITLIALVIALLACTGAGQAGAAQDDIRLEPLPLEEMKVTAYTKAFAKRFGLPDPKPGFELKGDLQAIEFSLEKGEFAPFYYVVFKLYMPQSLPIAYPEEGVAGRKHILNRGTHFFGGSPENNEQWLRWTVEDRTMFNTKQGRYNRKSYIASMDYLPKKRGLLSDITYEEYHKELIPGLAYIKLYTATPMFPNENAHWPLAIWLERQNGKDYERLPQLDPADFLKFELPKPFFKEVRKLVETAEENNKVVREEIYKRRREGKD